MGMVYRPGGVEPQRQPRLGYIPPRPFLPKTIRPKTRHPGFITSFPVCPSLYPHGQSVLRDGQEVVSLQRFFWPGQDWDGGYSLGWSSFLLEGVWKMRVLVACEYSGRVRDAFLGVGHEAMSCDLLPTEEPGPHYQGDVRDVLGDGWDLMVAHPPCTYLCSSGLHYNLKRPGRSDLTEEALEFVRLLWEAPIPRIAIENPIGCISTRMCKPTQIIQPYQFGHDASKSTCLWLKGLPKLVPTEDVPPRIVSGKRRWSNQTDSGQNRLSPSKDRWKIRSTTYPGIAQAMASQWSLDPELSF